MLETENQYDVSAAPEEILSLEQKQKYILASYAAVRLYEVQTSDGIHLKFTNSADKRVHSSDVR